MGDGDGGRAGEDGRGHRFEAGRRYGAVEVVVREQGVESAIRLFKRLVLKDGILRDLKRRERYEKPGERRRRKARESLRRMRKQRRRAMARGEQVD